jgi:hypothetical protein
MAEVKNEVVITGVGLAQYTKLSKVSEEQLAFFRKHGKDLSFNDPVHKVRVEAYETDDGVCIGRIFPIKGYPAG